MKTSDQLPRTGSNRTPMSLAPERAAEMMAMPPDLVPEKGVPRDFAKMRAIAAREALPAATNPPLSAGTRKKVSALVVDKLAERMSFERGGVRLYETLLLKHATYGTWRGGPSKDDLLHILQEELQHFEMLHRALRSLGADPTAVTASTNLAATISAGVCMAINDPRTNLLECLEAILVAELSDNACFEALLELVRAEGQDDLAGEIEEALEEEQEHLVKVKGWIAAAQGRAQAAPKKRRATASPRTPMRAAARGKKPAARGKRPAKRKRR